MPKKTGLSPRNYERAKKIIEEGSEEVKEKLRQGKTKISKEYEKIQRDIKRQELLSQINNINLRRLIIILKITIINYFMEIS